MEIQEFTFNHAEFQVMTGRPSRNVRQAVGNPGVDSEGETWSRKVKLGSSV